MSPELRQVLDSANAMSAAGQEPRRHHLVPRFYLERWAVNDRVRVTELDPPRKSYLTAPKNALVETDYYRITPGAVEGGSPVAWESWLSQVEGNAAPVFDQIDRDGLESLSESQWASFVHFIGVQITRSRSYRYQGRWMTGPGYYRLWELDRPGGFEHQLDMAGEEVTADRVTQLREYFDQVNSDPWSVPMSSEHEMQMASKAAGGLAETLLDRRFQTYSTDTPLLTSDEPVTLLYESMSQDHMNDGGFFGAPIVVFPLAPHTVLAMFRKNMPIVRSNLSKLTFSETLELNRVIAGNAHRQVVENPASKLGSSLYVPEFKEPMKFVNLKASEPGGKEFVITRSQRRWSGERDAPFRAVNSWWPPVVPAAPRPPTTRREWEQERRKYESY